MNTSSFEAFAAQARAEGYDEVVERRWPPDAVIETHTHPFAVHAVLTEGEMWLRTGEAEEEHLRPGDLFKLEAEAPHAERYGPQGAVYWVARRTPG